MNRGRKPPLLFFKKKRYICDAVYLSSFIRFFGLALRGSAFFICRENPYFIQRTESQCVFIFLKQNTKRACEF